MKRKFFCLGLFFVFLVMGYSSCTVVNEKPKVRTYKIHDVSAIYFKGSLNMILVPGNVTRMWVKGPAGRVENFDVRQNKSVLWLQDDYTAPKHQGSFILGNHDAMKVYLSVPHLDRMIGEGNAVITADKPLNLKRFYSHIKGNTVFKLDLLQSDSVKLDIDGNSIVKMNYIKCRYTELKITGNSVVTADYDHCISGKLEADDNSLLTLNGTMKQKLNIKTRDNVILTNHVKYVK